ncbi:hypothetical protein DRN58_09715 [Thermococci archaeon]|nr:MAG: hypothetical protein DRN58_09715 [Thermococci archaeon]
MALIVTTETSEPIGNLLVAELPEARKIIYTSPKDLVEVGKTPVLINIASQCYQEEELNMEKFREMAEVHFFLPYFLLQTFLATECLIFINLIFKKKGPEWFTLNIFAQNVVNLFMEAQKFYSKRMIGVVVEGEVTPPELLHVIKFIMDNKVISGVMEVRR